MKSGTTFLLLTWAGALGISGASAQSTAIRQKNAPFQSINSVAIHNSFNGSDLTGALALPSRKDAAPAILILAGKLDTEARSANTLAGYLVQRGFATLRLEDKAGIGSTDDTSLNVAAALNYLRSRPEIRQGGVGLLGYGSGTAAALYASSHGASPAFLALLGGSGTTRQTKSSSGGDTGSIRCPVLVLQSSSNDNSDGIRQALRDSGSPAPTVRVISGTGPELTDNDGRDAPRELSPAVLKTTEDWMNRQSRAVATTNPDDSAETLPRQPFQRLRPFNFTFEFPYRNYYEWTPSIGNQPRPYGLWYW